MSNAEPASSSILILRCRPQAGLEGRRTVVRPSRLAALAPQDEERGVANCALALLSLVFGLFAAIILPTPAAAQGQVTVYCSILEEQCREGSAIFQRETGIKVQMIRRSTGETFAQIKAEQNNPKGDVWWGGPAESHIQAAEEGLLAPYRSPMLAELQDWAVRHAERTKYMTAGTYLGVLGFGYNADVLKARNLPEPKCWADLTNPAYRDEIQVADPASSGTAYLFLATVVQIMGEDKGFTYLKALNRNITQYSKSGIAPVKAMTLGESAIGIAFIHDMITQILAGAPLKTVVPCEGTGYETGSVSLIKGGPAPENARRFYDFALGREAQTINARLKIFSIPSNRNAEVGELAPKLSEIKLIDYDAARWGAAPERSRLLKKFETDVKSAPR